MIRPRYADDKPALSATALKLLAKREQGDPALVKAGKLTQAQADDRARTARALATQWQKIVRRQPIPELPATAAEIFADLDAIATGAAAFAIKSPGTRDTLEALRAETAADWKAWKLDWPESDLPPGSFAVTADEFAQLVQALLWHQQPVRPGSATALVVFTHSINLEFWSRAVSARSKAA